MHGMILRCPAAAKAVCPAHATHDGGLTSTLLKRVLRTSVLPKLSNCGFRSRWEGDVFVVGHPLL